MCLNAVSTVLYGFLSRLTAGLGGGALPTEGAGRRLVGGVEPDVVRVGSDQNVALRGSKRGCRGSGLDLGEDTEGGGQLPR